MATVVTSLEHCWNPTVIVQQVSTGDVVNFPLVIQTVSLETGRERRWFSSDSLYSSVPGTGQLLGGV